MALVGLKEILKGSIEGKYAVAAFDVCDHVFGEAIIEAAEELKTPVIMMVGEYGFVDFDAFYPYLVERCRSAKVPVCLHFDHGPSYESCALAIRRGCTSVMFDGSQLPFAENVAITKKVVEMAHACGVDVEGEIGCIGSNEDSIEGPGSHVIYTEPADAVKFVEETGIDALAVAIGTVHGVYLKKPQLDFERLATIRSMVKIPLVMHGGSGLTEQNFADAVTNGMNKINAYTNVSIVAGKALRKVINDMPEETTHEEYTDILEKAAKEEIKRYIRMFKTRSLDK